MPFVTAAEWDRLTTPQLDDLPAIRVATEVMPRDWMTRSPSQLMAGAAVLAMRYDRLRMAEHLRNMVVFHTRSPEFMATLERLDQTMKDVIDTFLMTNDAALLDLATSIERGMPS